LPAGEADFFSYMTIKNAILMINAIFRNRRAVYAVALVLTVLAGTLAWNLSTTYFIDDLNYSLVAKPGDRAFWCCVGEPLTSFSQVPESISNHYTYVNGRLTNIIHICFQPLPRELECVVNSILLAAFFFLLLVVARPVGQSYPSIAASTLTLLLLGLAFAWYDGMQSADFQANYIWPGLGTVIFLLLWPRVDTMGRTAFAGYVVFTVLFAWLHEGFTCPVIAFAFFDILFGGRTRSLRSWILFAALWVGLLVCTSAGTVTRIDDYLEYSSLEQILHLLTKFISSVWPLYLALALMVVCRVRLGRRTMAGRWHSLFSLVCGALIGIVIAMVVGVFDRGLWAANLFAVLVCLRCVAYLSAESVNRPCGRAARVCVMLFCVSVLGLTAWWFAGLVRWQRVITAEQKTIAGELKATAPATVVYTGYTPREQVPFYLMGIPYHCFEHPVHNTYCMYYYCDNDSAFIAVLPPSMRPVEGDTVDAFSRMPPLSSDGTCRGQWPFVFSRIPDVDEIRVDVAEIDGSVNPIDRLIIALRSGCPARRDSYHFWCQSSPVIFPDGTVAYMYLPYYKIRSAYGRRIVEIECISSSGRK